MLLLGRPWLAGTILHNHLTMLGFLRSPISCNGTLVVGLKAMLAHGELMSAIIHNNLFHVQVVMVTCPVFPVGNGTGLGAKVRGCEVVLCI